MNSTEMLNMEGVFGGIGIGELLMPLAVLLGAAAVMLGAPGVYDVIIRSIRRIRARVRLAEHPEKGLARLVFEDLCRNGIQLLHPLTTRIVKLKRVNAWCAQICEALESVVPTVSPRTLCELMIVVVCTVACALYVLTGQLVIALLGSLIPLFISTRRAHEYRLRRRALLREQLPDALGAIGMCFSAGLSLQQALAQTARETLEPLGGQLRQTVHDIEVGHGIPDALQNLEKRTNCADLRFVLVALEIQQATGGSLREILEGAANSISESFDLARTLEVQTAQARMSARIVTIMPLALLAVLSLAMPGYLTTFFSSAAGLILLLGALGLEVCGIFMIRRILNIDLSASP